MSQASPFDITGAIRKGILGLLTTSIVIALIVILFLQLSSVQEQMASLFEQTDWLWVFWGWIWMCIALWLLGYRWKALLPSDVEVSGLFLGSALCSALLLNYAIPGPAGELASAWLVEKEIERPYSTIFAAGAVARLIGLMVAAFGAALIWMLGDFNIPQAWQMPMQLGVVSIFFGGVILFVLLIRPSWWRKKITAVPKSGILGKITEVLLKFIDAMIQTAQRGKKAYFKAFVWSVIGHFAALLGILFSLYGVFKEIEVWGIAFAYLATTSVGALAFLVPGSQLPWDAFFTGVLFSTTSLDLVESTSAAGLLRIEQMGMMFWALA
ncbi:MAG: hypothetical protein CMK59_02485 [Proteobacteria bacterium]|nr:hypothetical protein [Pseudomonadota bacterium]